MSLKCLKSSCTLLSENLHIFRRGKLPMCRYYFENRDILKLRERDMFYDIFPEQCCNEIRDFLVQKPRYVYAGFDPTASSLHVGNLLILKNLLHWQRAGHKVIALIGGATAVIGDPSGRIEDRVPQSRETIEKHGHQIQKIIDKIFKNHETYFWSKVKDAAPLPPITYMNNMDWYDQLNVIQFLDTIGRHFRMGQMLLKDSVRKRIESEYGMSFTEFSYQTFQAYDWYHLYKEFNCKFQVGGKDQMGNMEAGHRLIRRLLNKPSYAFTMPLITDDAGDKFGKSVPNAVWLDSALTSPFEFYQFFLRLRDAEACKILKCFSFRPIPELHSVLMQHERAPEKRLPQTALAEEITVLVHGEEGLENARNTTNILYSQSLEYLKKVRPQELKKVLKGCTVIEYKFRPGLSIVDFALDIRCFLHKSDALRIIQTGGFYINHERVKNPDEVISQSVHILPNNLTHVRVGKRNIYLIEWIFESV